MKIDEIKKYIYNRAKMAGLDVAETLTQYSGPYGVHVDVTLSGTDEFTVALIFKPELDEHLINHLINFLGEMNTLKTAHPENGPLYITGKEEDIIAAFNGEAFVKKHQSHPLAKKTHNPYVAKTPDNFALFKELFRVWDPISTFGSDRTHWRFKSVEVKEPYDPKINQRFTLGDTTPATNTNKNKTETHSKPTVRWSSRIPALSKAEMLESLKNRSGIPPLHYAVQIGKVDIVEALLRYDFDVNLQDASGMTPLHYAVKLNNPKIVEILIKNGADCFIENREGEKPLDQALDRMNPNIVGMLVEKMKSTNKPFSLQSLLKSVMDQFYPFSDNSEHFQKDEKTYTPDSPGSMKNKKP